MSISVSCGCGRSLRIKDELAGRKIRCPSCEGVLLVRASESVETPTAVVAEGRPKPPPLRMPRERDRDDERRVRAAVPPRPRPMPRDDEDDEEEEERPRRRKKKRRPRPSSSEDSGSFGIVIEPQIITGLLMMIGAAVWFFVALSRGVIFFYPPVLFVLGAATMIRGFTGGD